MFVFHFEVDFSNFFYRVIAQNNEVNGFMLDPSIGEFVLTDPKMTIPKVGAGKKNLYSINEGYENKWEPAVLEYVKTLWCSIHRLHGG